MASEAACLPASRGARVSCAGASSERARVLAERLLADGCEGLLSFGVAGALDPDLEPGDLIVADRVVVPDGRSLTADAAWADRLVACLTDLTPRRAALAGAVEAVHGPDAKAALGRSAGVAAVDMESHAVATAAAAAGCPFLAVRVVSDPARRRLPAWIGQIITDDGRPRPWTAAAYTVTRPWELPDVIRMAGDFARAMRVLRRVAVDAGPLFQFRAA